MLSCNNNNGGKQVRPGVYAEECTIISARTVTGETPNGWDSPIEFGVEITLQKQGIDFTPKLTLHGKLKRETDTASPKYGQVIAWGSAFPVRDLLNRVGGYAGNIGEDLAIPQVALDMLTGKKVVTLSYVKGIKEDGKKAYATWNRVAKPEEVEYLLKSWDTSVNGGYIKNYMPELASGTTTAPMTEGDAVPAGIIPDPVGGEAW